MHRFIGRLALITGASSGIGQGIAERLAKEGMRVIACARRIDRLEKNAEDIQKWQIDNQHNLSINQDALKFGEYLPIECDVSNIDSIEETFERLTKDYGTDLRIASSCAGVAHSVCVLDGNRQLTEDIFKVNVLGMAAVIENSYRIMRKNEEDNVMGPSGVIININSIFGHKVWKRPQAHFYVGSKFAARAIVEGARLESRLVKSRIRIGEISPGYVQTEMVEKSGGKKLLDEIESIYKIPMTPADIAETLVYCASIPDHVCVEEIILQPVDSHD